MKRPLATLLMGTLLPAAAGAAQPQPPSHQEVVDALQRAQEAAKNVQRPDFSKIQPQKPNLDLSAIARQHEQRVPKGEFAPKPRLYAFVSWSMPEGSLLRIARDLRKTGGIMVFRGFPDNSMSKWSQKLLPINQKVGNFESEVNPKAFVLYNVARVPAYVIVRSEQQDTSCEQSGCNWQTSAKVTGDVSLSYALQQVVKEDRRMADLAGSYLRMLGGH